MLIRNPKRWTKDVRMQFVRQAQERRDSRRLGMEMSVSASCWVPERSSLLLRKKKLGQRYSLGEVRMAPEFCDKVCLGVSDTLLVNDVLNEAMQVKSVRIARRRGLGWDKRLRASKPLEQTAEKIDSQVTGLNDCTTSAT